MKWKDIQKVPEFRKTTQDFFEKINATDEPITSSDKDDFCNAIRSGQAIGRFNFSEEKDCIYDVKSGEGIRYGILEQKVYLYLYNQSTE